MARSDSRDFKLNRNELIKRAFQLVNIYDITSTIPNDDMNYAADMLNILLKELQTQNIHLWNRKTATLFTANDTAQYDLGSTGTHATKSYISTQLDGAVTSGGTSLTVDSTTGMTVGDNIGIELDDGTREWTTIATIPSSVSLTVNDVLTGDANDNAYIVAYTTKITRPLLVLNARQADLTNNTEITMQQLRRNDYFNISDKTSAGHPNAYYYDKQLDNGVLYIWPRPDNVDFIINFTFYEDVEDMDTGTDDFDYPTEWTKTIIYSLAEDLASAYSMYEELKKIERKALFLRNEISKFNFDEESVVISPDDNGQNIL